VLHAYLDDSGTHKESPLCVVAGYFGSERHWNNLALRWRKVLDAEGIDEFHANRFWSHVGGANVPEYRNWDEARSSRFLAGLLDVIGESKRIFPVCSTVVMQEWNLLPDDERNYLTGAAFNIDGQLRMPGAPKKPYFLPFLNVIATVLDYCKPGHKVDFFCDQNTNFSGYAQKYFQDIKGWASNKDKSRILEKFGRLGNLSFADSRANTPIQAADLLAYESYLYGVNRMQKAMKELVPRPALVSAVANMLNFRLDAKMFDKYGIDLMLAQHRAVRGGVNLEA